MKKLKEINKKDLLIIISITIVGLLLRILWLNGKSGDYTTFLKPWIDQINVLGNFHALKYDIGDYNIPYIIILTLISTLKCNPLYPIKFVSIIFDFICAIYGAKIVKFITNNKLSSIVSYGLILILPTVLINSSLWGQCDSIYTSFILVSIYLLMKEKYTKSFIFLGISFAFKLQVYFKM